MFATSGHSTRGVPRAIASALAGHFFRLGMLALVHLEPLQCPEGLDHEQGGARPRAR